MTVLRGLILLFCLVFTTSALAESSIVYAGSDVHKPTVKRWNKAVNSASFGSVSWVWNIGSKDRKHKNKSRDTILMVPHSTIPESLTLVVWFHGLGGFSQKTFNKRIIPQMESLVEAGNSVVIAIPEMPWSINTTTPRKRQGKVWRRPGELERYIDDVKEHLETWAIVSHGIPLGSVRLIFVGHSAGGSALMSSAIEGGICKLRPDAIVWSDASYGYWLDRTWKSCVKDLEVSELHILVRKWDKPHKNAERVHKQWKRPRQTPGRDIEIYYYVLDRKNWTHNKIGSHVFEITDLFPPGC